MPTNAREIVSNTSKISAFKWTDFEQSIELRYRDDEQTSGLGLLQQRSLFEQEYSLNGKAYIYHPNFLKLDLGLAPIFRQVDFATTSGENSSSTNDYNLYARFKFLEKKPYPITLFYENSHPFVQLSLTDRFEQETEKYGFDINVRKPALPFNVGVGSMQSTNKGEGFDVKIDDEIKQHFIRTDFSTGGDGTARLQLTTTDKISSSGFVSQPVNTIEVKTDSLNFDSRNLYGENSEIQFTNRLTQTKREDVRPLEQLLYTPRLTWNHSDTLRSYYQLDYSDSDQDVVFSKTLGIQSGLHYKSDKNTEWDFGFNIKNNDNTGFEQKSNGLNGRVLYSIDTSVGKLSLNGNWNLNSFDRDVVSTVPVADLELSLDNNLAQFLPHNNILASSIRVFRLISGNEVELIVGVDTACGTGIDILITTIDARIQIENCNGATDGIISVNIDYTYDPGGSAEYDNLSQNYNVNLEINEYNNLYLRYSDIAVDIKSGDPVISLDERSTMEMGWRLNFPVTKSLNLGGELIYEDEKGTLLSFNRETLNLYARYNTRESQLQFSIRNNVIDYLNSQQDVDLTLYTLSLKMRPWKRFIFYADYNTQKDQGRSVEQKSQSLSLKLKWQRGKFSVLGEANMVEDTYNTITRDRSSIRISMKRDFK